MGVDEGKRNREENKGTSFKYTEDRMVLKTTKVDQYVPSLKYSYELNFDQTFPL